MSLILQVAQYIDAHSDLTLDTDLFIGGDVFDSPDNSVCILSSPGGFESQSGLQGHPVQVLTKSKSFISGETLIWSVYNLLAEKPGFADTITDVFYCQTLSIPAEISRLPDSSIVFSFNLLIRKE